MRTFGIAMIGLAGTLAACAPRQAVIPLEQRTGTFHFREMVPGSTGTLFEGSVTLGDTIAVSTLDGPCVLEVPGRRSTASDFIVFECPNARVYLHRLNPEQRSSYQVRSTVRVARRVCDEYGARGCVRYSTDYQDQLTWRGGQLRLLTP